MKKQTSYKDLAKYYDPLHSWKDYDAEVKKLIKIISKNKKSKGKELLDVACGTGMHLKYLKKSYNCFGIDLNYEMIKIARKNVKNVIFNTQNMINFKIHKKFDIITCLFSSIALSKTKNNLKKTIENFSRHLKPGGVLLIEPFFSRSEFKGQIPYMHTYESDDLKIARISYSELSNKTGIIHMDYLIGEKNKPIKRFVDKLEVGIFEVDDTLQFMKNAGLKSKYLKHGLKMKRGLYVGVKK